MIKTKVVQEERDNVRVAERPPIDSTLSDPQLFPIAQLSKDTTPRQRVSDINVN